MVSECINMLCSWWKLHRKNILTLKNCFPSLLQSFWGHLCIHKMKWRFRQFSEQYLWEKHSYLLTNYLCLILIWNCSTRRLSWWISPHLSFNLPCHNPCVFRIIVYLNAWNTKLCFLAPNMKGEKNRNVPL